ncbi:CACNA1E [Symbiodinium natans]|uniref:CACNA1E protein n=1 Tax=Symbiodinium natans TaxID=878477 RepID=A0A812T7U6_9DINO|nr:CACNA1E [Symbiodinium natans]
MSLAGCCTVKLPCPPPAPDADTSHATDLLTRCQQTHEELGNLLCSLSFLERKRDKIEKGAKTPDRSGSTSKESNRHSESDAGDRREVRFDRRSYGYGPQGPQAFEPPPPLMMALPMKPEATVESLRPLQPAQPSPSVPPVPTSSPPRGRAKRGDSSKGTATSRLPNEGVNNTYSINGITSQPIQVFRNSLVDFIRSNYSSIERQETCCSRTIASFVMFCAWLLDLKEPERTGRLARAVDSTAFAFLSTVVILANAVFILYATDYEMQHLSNPTNAQIRSVDLSLAGFYVVEVLLKLIVHKLFFFWNSEWRWNIFDFSLVLFAIVENVLAYDWMHGTKDTGVNLGFLRLFRLCKIVKILRIFRTLKFFSELRLMLDCMIGSLLNVIWCVVMMVFVMYVFALFVQQLLASFLVEDGGRDSPEAVAEISSFFGSVGMTLITLFQASTSGVDWKEPYDALWVSGPVLPTAFLFYVAFVFISVWNIITSTFVEKALKLAQPDIDLLVMEQQLQDYEDTQMLAQLFAHMLQTDEDGLPRVGLEEFRHLVENSEFRSYLQTRGIDIKNAETFFKMLVELHGEPTIDAITFANACVRMKGAATSIDLQTVMYTTHLMNKEQRRAFQFMYSRLKSIESMLRAGHRNSRCAFSCPL